VIIGLGVGGVALYQGLNAPTPPAPLVIGHAPANPADHVQVDDTADPYGYDAVEDWPNACDLLTDQDIRSIFPAATGDIHREATADDIFVNDVSGQSVGEQLDVPNATCTFGFRLPASTDPEDSKVTVGVDGVGRPSTLRQNMDKTVATGCTYRPGYDTYLCGWVEVSASVEFLNIADDTHAGKSIDRFLVGKKVTSFDVDDSLGPQAKAEKKFEDTYVAPELIKAVLAKLALP
jgi:hypothetical protein